MNKVNKCKLRSKMISTFPSMYDLLNALKFGIQTLSYGKNGWPTPPSYWVKRWMLLKEAKRIQAKSFVETGTYLGDTTWFLRKAFDNIITIEVDPTLAKLAENRFSSHQNVKVVLGDSAELLKNVVAEILSPTLFWLDGHYSGGITGRGAKDCPIWEELDAISMNSDKKNYSIFIDDAREFGRNQAYPKLEDIEDYAKSRFQGFTFSVENDIIKIIQGSH